MAEADTKPGNVVALPVRQRQPGEDDDLVDEEDPRGPNDMLQAAAADALAHGDFTEAARLAEELRRRTTVAETIPWIGWREIMAPLPPMDWVVEGLEIAQGPPAMIAGYGYSGKTISAQSLILSAASGCPVWGELPLIAGPVAHVDGEQGERLCRDRYQRLGRSLGVELEQLMADGDMRLSCYPRTKLAEESELSWCRLFEGRRLVLLDSLRALLPPNVDENSSAVRHHLDMLARVSEQTGAAVVVLHHARKAQKDAPGGLREVIRGSSGLFDALSSCIVFAGEKGEAPSVHHEKARITGQLFESFGLEIFDEASPDGGDLRWGVRVRKTDLDQLARTAAAEKHEQLLGAVEAYIRAHPACSGRMVRAGVPGSNQAIVAGLDELALEGRITNLGTPARPEWRVK
jgi:hypothetical protein